MRQAGKQAVRQAGRVWDHIKSLLIRSVWIRVRVGVNMGCAERHSRTISDGDHQLGLGMSQRERE